MKATAEPGERSAPPDRDSWSEEVDGLDLAVYHVTMSRTTSFPSGHAASASAFATGAATASPQAGILISAAAALVAYSRVHTGVHYADVIAGTLTGASLAQMTAAAVGPVGMRENSS